MDRNLERRTDDADWADGRRRYGVLRRHYVRGTLRRCLVPIPASPFLLFSSSLFDLHLLRWNVDGLAFIHGEGKRAIHTFTKTSALVEMLNYFRDIQPHPQSFDRSGLDAA